jgi:hypothetical protein
LLAEERSPDELAAGLREWGSGEARIVSARLLDLDGDERKQFASGEPLVVELVVASDASVAPPLVSLELRDDDGVVLAGLSQSTSALGWRSGGARTLRGSKSTGFPSPMDASTFAAHWWKPKADASCTLDDAASFFVFPAGGHTGSVLLTKSLVDGESLFWANRFVSHGPPCPTAAADGARTGCSSHYTCARRLPADALVNVRVSTTIRCALRDLESCVPARSTPGPGSPRALRASHWFDLREWAARGPGASAA